MCGYLSLLMLGAVLQLLKMVLAPWDFPAFAVEFKFEINYDMSRMCLFRSGLYLG